MPEEFLKGVVIKANIKNKTSVIKLNEIRNCKFAHDVGCAGNEGSDIPNEGDNEPSGAVLLPKTTKTRISTNGTEIEHIGLKQPMASTINSDDLRMNSTDAIHGESNFEESRDQTKIIKPGNADIIRCEQNEVSLIRKQKPVLIPAKEFIGRYFNSYSSSGVGNKSHDLEDSDCITEGHYTARDKRGCVANATDDQKIIEGLSNISINNHCNQNITDNEKLCFQ